jgi:hypothetical protein
MDGSFGRLGRSARTASAVVAALFAISSGAAGAACALCDTEVVMNAELATCFLEQYDKLAKEGGSTIMVDLSDCAESRGIVEGLPTVGTNREEPNTEFVVSHEQLECLRQKLEDPNIELDPAAKIDLSACS